MSFVTGARESLGCLRARLGFDAAVLVRRCGDDWVVLQSAGESPPVHEGASFPWAESLCARLAADEGPRILPRLADAPAYASAPLCSRWPIGAYAGALLRNADDSLFGTLCAFHSQPRPAAITAELPLLALLAHLLQSLLAAERRSVTDERRAERAEVEHLADPLTGLPGKEAWERLLAGEEARCRAYGDAACVASVDLGGEHGDLWVRRAAVALRGACREDDIVARVEADEFVVLGVGCDATAARALALRLEKAIEAVGVPAALECVVRVPAEGPLRPASGLTAAWRSAGQAMYARRRSRLIHT